MTFKQFLEQEAVGYGTIAYIDSEKSLEVFCKILMLNITTINRCKRLIIALNVSEDYRSYVEKVLRMYLNVFINVPTDIHILEENRGHTFGTMDLDLAVFNKAREYGTEEIKYLIKTSGDTVVLSTILDRNLELGPAAHVMNSFSYETLMIKKEIDLEYYRDQNKDCAYRMLPQTNFYILDLSQIRELYSASVINEKYNKIEEIPNYNGKPWEYFENFSSEHLLQEVIKDNYVNFLTLEEEEMLARHVISNGIGDPSHKNILVGSVCHCHYPDKGISLLSN